MREINDHKVIASDPLSISAIDSNHAYMVSGFNTGTNPSGSNEQPPDRALVIYFQNGMIPDVGVNGVTNEALLAIVADRLRGFQAGPYPCKENAEALRHIEEAMHWHQQRTIDRMRRGVDGGYRS